LFLCPGYSKLLTPFTRACSEITILVIFPYKSSPTQLRISNPSFGLKQMFNYKSQPFPGQDLEHSQGSSEFPNQNLRQVGQGG